MGLNLDPLKLRYCRQTLIDGIGESGQAILGRARVLIAGAGGLGGMVALHLAAAGIGHLGIVDNDVIEMSNLNRQLLYSEGQIGRKKADTARDRIKAFNPHIEVKAICETIDGDSIKKLARGYDMMVDGLDNFTTRYVLNHAALQLNLPLFHGAVQSFEGHATTIIAGKTPCLKCIYPRAPQPDVIPVIGVAPALIASLQATEVIKYILGLGELLTGRLLVYDGLSMEFMQIRLKKKANCPECGTPGAAGL